MLRAPSLVVAYNIAKMQIMRRIASCLKVLWYGTMEWKMKENFSMESKIFSMEWKWNGRKLPVWNMEKSSSIPFHIMPCQQEGRSVPYTWTNGKINEGYLKLGQLGQLRKTRMVLTPFY